MHPDDQRKLSASLIVGLPVLFWITAVQKTEQLSSPKLLSLWKLLKVTHTKPILLAAAIGGLAVAILLVWFINSTGKGEFSGAHFWKFLRETQIVPVGRLRQKTTEKAQQVSIASVPMPTRLEALHLLVNGANWYRKIRNIA
ncbi:MAG: hypothetical protein JSC189_000772 [Candidatus Tokpelaia sp. JSC189]|nr:MAG: hypothetical protein JSC189_000772 [Candidatus Tokpelaia sp. JSC189]